MQKASDKGANVHFPRMFIGRPAATDCQISVKQMDFRLFTVRSQSFTHLLLIDHSTASATPPGMPTQSLFQSLRVLTPLIPMRSPTLQKKIFLLCTLRVRR